MKLFVRASSFTVVLCAIAIAFFAIQTSARQSTPAVPRPRQRCKQLWRSTASLASPDASALGARIHNDAESDLIAAIFRASATSSSNDRFDVACGSATADYALGSGGRTGGVFNG